MLNEFCLPVHVEEFRFGWVHRNWTSLFKNFFFFLILLLLLFLFCHTAVVFYDLNTLKTKYWYSSHIHTNTNLGMHEDACGYCCRKGSQPVQIPDNVIYISLCANAPVKGMNSSLHHSATNYGQIVGQIGL